MPIVGGEVQQIGQVVAHVRNLPKPVMERVQRVMALLGSELRVAVQQKLSGEVLRVRTGALKASIQSNQVRSATVIEQEVGIFAFGANPQAMFNKGFVGAAYQRPRIYGRAHEFGFDGVVTVRAHMRTITQVFGMPVTPRQIQIPSYSYHMKLPKRSFLRTALEEFAPHFFEEVAKAVDEGVHA